MEEFLTAYYVLTIYARHMPQCQIYRYLEYRDGEVCEWSSLPGDEELPMASMVDQCAEELPVANMADHREQESEQAEEPEWVIVSREH